MRGRGSIRITHAEVNHILATFARSGLQFADYVEDIGREPVNSGEFGHGMPLLYPRQLRSLPGESRSLIRDPLPISLRHLHVERRRVPARFRGAIERWCCARWGGRGRPESNFAFRRRGRGSRFLDMEKKQSAREPAQHANVLERLVLLRTVASEIWIRMHKELQSTNG